MSRVHSAAFAMLEYSIINHAGFTVITGEIGSGKTTLLGRLLKGLTEKHVVGVVNNTHSHMGALLPWVLHSFGQKYDQPNPIALYDSFLKFLQVMQKEGKRVILVIDEAQNLPSNVLEELRTLTNINTDKKQLLQIILLGQPELREMLRRPELKQFAQRVAVDYYIPALGMAETKEYIEFWLARCGRSEPLFTPEACQLIHHVTGGIPRIINIVCDTALSFGFGDQLQLIDADYVRDVLRERAEGGVLALARDPDSYYREKKLSEMSLDELINNAWDATPDKR